MALPGIESVLVAGRGPAACAVIFFWARVAHPIAMVSQVWGTRTITFAIAWAAAVVHLFVVLTAGT